MAEDFTGRSIQVGQRVRVIIIGDGTIRHKDGTVVKVNDKKTTVDFPPTDSITNAILTAPSEYLRRYYQRLLTNSFLHNRIVIL